jgi:hypothetical protein
VREEDVTGLKYLDELAPLLSRLHEVGVVLDAIVRIGEYKDAADRPDHPRRLVVIETAPQRHSRARNPVENV